MATKCNNCGATVPDNATACPYCGNPVTPSQNLSTTNAEDVPVGWMNAISFFVPVAGWVFYFVKRNETPIKAKACAKWAWIGFGVTVFIELLAALFE